MRTIEFSPGFSECMRDNIIYTNMTIYHPYMNQYLHLTRRWKLHKYVPSFRKFIQIY